MNLLRPLACLVALLMIVGCATPKQVITRALPPLRLAAAETRRTTAGITAEVQFPAGEYRASFRDAAGVYYAPSAQILLSGRTVTDAYLFVSDAGGRHALFLQGAIKVDWLDAQLPVRSAP